MTLFSAPNYRGEFDNAGAMMNIDETLRVKFQVCPVLACVLTCTTVVGRKHKTCLLHSTSTQLTRGSGALRRGSAEFTLLYMH